MPPLPPDYAERVYAGILGKIIGVYLGRPFEGWTYERIMAELGEVRYYVHERLGKPLVVADDDISGTFTFLRALPDRGNYTDDWQPSRLRPIEDSAIPIGVLVVTAGEFDPSLLGAPNYGRFHHPIARSSSVIARSDLDDIANRP